MMLLVLALHVTLSTPQPVVDIDGGKLKGDVARLAWAPDGNTFYLQTVERDKTGRVLDVKHYLVSPVNKSIKNVDAEPPWAAQYWAWKSGRTAPGVASFKIDIAEREETFKATASPTGGVMAKGSPDPNTGTTLEEVANAANQSQRLLIRELKVGSDPIGTWVNEPVIPGFTFSWAPTPLKFLAFAKRDRKDGGPIVVADQTGQRIELTGPKAAILPAWSDDGRRIAWLERKDKRKFQLMIADISAD
jgi:hypothetical protein